MTDKLLIIGAGGHAVSVANVALSANYQIAGFIDTKKNGSILLGYPVIGSFEALGDPLDFIYAIAIGDNFSRSKCYLEICSKYPGIAFPPLVHHSSIISNFSSIDQGSVLMPQSLVGPNTKIGRFCILNSNSSIDHDGIMGDFSSLAPGAILGGSVSIGSGSAISIGAVIKHGITVGNDVVLGANSYLNINLDDGCLAYGSPAQTMRHRLASERYL